MEEKTLKRGRKPKKGKRTSIFLSENLYELIDEQCFMKNIPRTVVLEKLLRKAMDGGYIATNNLPKEKNRYKLGMRVSLLLAEDLDCFIKEQINGNITRTKVIEDLLNKALKN